jgi:hypothetical protein
MTTMKNPPDDPAVPVTVTLDRTTHGPDEDWTQRRVASIRLDAAQTRAVEVEIDAGEMRLFVQALCNGEVIVTAARHDRGIHPSLDAGLDPGETLFAWRYRVPSDADPVDWFMGLTPAQKAWVRYECYPAYERLRASYPDDDDGLPDDDDLSDEPSPA